MEELEVPLEKLSEDMQERAHHEREDWVLKAAINSAIYAVFAAIAAMLAGHYSNEAMIEQLQASDQWSYYQAKGIKSALLSSHIELLEILGKHVDEERARKLAEYKKVQEEIAELAREKEAHSQRYLRYHQRFARSVTFFQVAIAISAIAVLSRRRQFIYLGLVFGGIGLVFFGLGFFLG